MHRKDLRFKKPDESFGMWCLAQKIHVAVDFSNSAGNTLNPKAVLTVSKRGHGKVAIMSIFNRADEKQLSEAGMR